MTLTDEKRTVVEMWARKTMLEKGDANTEYFAAKYVLELLEEHRELTDMRRKYEAGLKNQR